MANVNKVILLGRLTADPELKTTQSGIAVTSFTVAVNKRFSKQGEQSSADFISCVAWRNTAEFICKYFSKGNAIYLEGALSTRNWQDKEGKTRYITEVVVDEAQFVEPKRDSAPRADREESPAVFSNIPSDDFSEIGDDDELPF